MKPPRLTLSWSLFPVVLLLLPLLAGVMASTAWAAPDAYVASCGSSSACGGNGTVSVIDTATDTVVATVDVGVNPTAVAVSPDGSRVYVANGCSTCSKDGTLSVIDAANNTVVGSPITVGGHPAGVVVSPGGSRAYVANSYSDTVSVIDTAADTVVATVDVGGFPIAVAVSQDGSRLYVANNGSGTVSVIDTADDAGWWRRWTLVVTPPQLRWVRMAAGSMSQARPPPSL